MYINVATGIDVTVELSP